MRQVIETTLNGVTIGDPIHFRGMSLFPLFQTTTPKQEYVMLRTAFQKGWLRVTEISEGGSVPELKLFNESEASVLILDGEELEGAKQNRVLNTSLLVKGKSELLVPVSCTEQGRWSRISEEFADSEKVLFRKARAKKMERVSESLKYGGGYQSDQSEIWSDISMAQADFNAYSPTSAMKHVYDAQKTTIDQYLGAFPIEEGQVGFIAGLGGRLAGLEYISRPECYAEVHKRLVESYALDCLRERYPEGELSLAESQRFLEQVWSAKAESFPSVSKGTDVRLESEELIGMALVEDEEVIHLSAFSRQSSSLEKSPRMANYRSRMKHPRRR